MAVIKEIRKVGNGCAIPLDKTLLALTGLRVGDKVAIDVDGPRMTISPAQTGVGAEQIRQSMKKIRVKYGQALRELAK